MRKKPEALANRGGILLAYEKSMKELRKELPRIQQAIAAYVSTHPGCYFVLYIQLRITVQKYLTVLKQKH